MSKSNTYNQFMVAKVAPKEQRVAMRIEYRQLRKTYEFWDYLNLVWRKYQKKCCYYCGVRLRVRPTDVFVGLKRADYHLDHKLPIYRGGTNDYSNFCLACPPCNLLKAGDLLERTYIPGVSKKKMAEKRAAGKYYF